MTLGNILLPLFLLLLLLFVWHFAPKGWKTRLFNWGGLAGTGLWSLLTLLLPALQGVSFDGVLPGTIAAIAAIFIQVGNVMLREVTDSKAGSAK
jgi:hypothetical protein